MMLEKINVKSRPAIFSAPMMCANLHGMKSMTRRLIKFHSPSLLSDCWRQAVQIPGDNSWIFWDHDKPGNVELTAKVYNPGAGITSPYGVPGDQLWPRETVVMKRYGGLWNISDSADVKVTYLADGTVLYFTLHGEEKKNFKPGKKPAIFMPRYASRQILEIVDVQPSLLQSISIDDIIAEGCPQLQCDEDASQLYEWYSTLWDSLNAKPKPIYRGKRVPGTPRIVDHYVSYPWEDIRETRTHRGKPWFVCGNPWVWGIKYKVLETL